MTPAKLPWSIEENPLLSQWVDFSEPGIARVFSAKVEIGQGIVTAIAQIAATELRLPMSKVVVVSGDTRCCPNESYTAGSMSIEVGGTSVRMACAEARRRDRRARCAIMLSADESRIAAEDGLILLDGAPSGLDYWQVAREIDWKHTDHGNGAIRGALVDSTSLGKSVARLDLPAKVTGASFIHDLEIAGNAAWTGDAAAVLRRAAGITRHVGGRADARGCQNLDERRFRRRLLRARISGRQGTRSDPRRRAMDLRARFPPARGAGASCCRRFARSIQRPRPASALSRTTNLRRLSATYSRPPIAHASMAPSCAVAVYDESGLTVWTHSQGVFPLRGALANALGIDQSHVAVIHQQGAGVYGHNAADDVALDAALLARQVPSRPVRIQWTREDELAWSPLGSPMAIKIEGALESDRRHRRLVESRYGADRTASVRARTDRSTCWQPRMSIRRSRFPKRTRFCRDSPAVLEIPSRHTTLFTGRSCCTACRACRFAPPRCARWAATRTCSQPSRSWMNWPMPRASIQSSSAFVTCRIRVRAG